MEHKGTAAECATPTESPRALAQASDAGTAESSSATAPAAEAPPPATPVSAATSPGSVNAPRIGFDYDDDSQKGKNKMLSLIITKAKIEHFRIRIYLFLKF